jgi:hypothetical protein
MGPLSLTVSSRNPVTFAIPNAPSISSHGKPEASDHPSYLHRSTFSAFRSRRDILDYRRGRIRSELVWRYNEDVRCGWGVHGGWIGERVERRRVVTLDRAEGGDAGGKQRGAGLFRRKKVIRGRLVLVVRSAACIFSCPVGGHSPFTQIWTGRSSPVILTSFSFPFDVILVSFLVSLHLYVSREYDQE